MQNNNSQRSQQQNRQDFAELYRMNKKVLINLATARGFSKESAEDISQEAFLRLHKAMQGLTPDCSRAYLIRIALNLINEQWRSRKCHDQRALQISEVSESRYSFAADSDASERRRQGGMAIALAESMSAHCLGHLEFKLCYDEGVSKTQIATRLQSNQRTVLSRVFRYINQHKKKWKEALEMDCFALMQEEISECTRRLQSGGTGRRVV